jgi:cytochrome c oxidase subunit 3
MSSTTHGTTPYYFVPGPSAFPVMAATGLLFVILGAAQWINGHQWGMWSLLAGMVIWLGTLFVWFSQSIRESEGGLYGHKVDLSAGA